MGTALGTQPLVLGRLGPRHPGWQDLTAAAGVTVRTLVDDDVVALASSPAPGLEAVPGSAWCWGRVVPGTRRPGSPDDAAHELLLSGTWCDGEEVAVHTDLLGLGDVFVRQVGPSTFFSNRLTPLTALGGGLTTDVAGWGASYGFYGFVDETTPFREIQRLRFGEVLRLRRGRVTLEQSLPRWLTDPGDPASVPELVEALVASLPPRSLRRRHITLSGGWDSRLIALGLRARGGRQPLAWSTPSDDGYGDDLQLAGAVARGLGLRHRVVQPADGSFLADRRRTLARTEHLTWLHTWLTPLAAEMRGPVPLLDGFAGDVLFKDEVGQVVATGRDADHRTELLWRQTGGSRVAVPGLFRAEVAADWADSTLARVAREQERWAGHPAEFALRKLVLRNARVMAASPLRLFAPETPVLLPLVHPEMLRAVLTVPVQRRAEGALMRDLLHTLDPVVGSLRSTNDKPRTLPLAEPPRQTRPAVLRRLRRKVLADDLVMDLLHPDLASRLTRPRGRSLADVRGVLTWGAALADWRRQHAGVLADGPGRTGDDADGTDDGAD